MQQQKSISGLVRAGQRLDEMIHAYYDDESSDFMKTLHHARQLNPWFTISNQHHALKAVAGFLQETKLQEWISHYPNLQTNTTGPKSIGLVMAGNIPLVGFHDLLCVLVSGHRAMIKCSSDDVVLVHFLYKLLLEAEPDFNSRFTFTDRISNIDAVIATGSDNSSRYFKYYFGKYPHIIRKNRNAVAVLKGNEALEELHALAEDIFLYFGMGCRNVSKLYVPEGYSFNSFFEAMEKYAAVTEHNKYMSNYDYYQAILLLKKVPFLTNNFLIVKEDSTIATPVSILNYSYYTNPDDLQKSLLTDAEKIQCIVSGKGRHPSWIPFGKAQQPGLTDYADGVDTMKFLEDLT